MADDIDSILGVSPDSPHPANLSRVVDRYRDAYLVASAAVGFSTLIKILGWIVAHIIWIAGFVAASQQGGDGQAIYATIRVSPRMITC